MKLPDRERLDDLDTQLNLLRRVINYYKCILASYPDS